MTVYEGSFSPSGETASLFNVNIRTLRYYDKIGLLRPEWVDPDTGYRYYSTKQFERLNTILYLKALKVPLEKNLFLFQVKKYRRNEKPS